MNYSVDVLFRRDGKLNSAILRNNRIDRLYPGLKEWIMEQFPEYDDLRNKILSIKNGGPCLCSVCGAIMKFPNHISSINRYCSPKCGNNNERKIAAIQAATQTEEVREKRKQTMINRYGCETPFHSSEKQAMARSTFRERYGVDSPSQVAEFREKAKATLHSRYGVDNPSKEPKFVAKAAATMLSKYGEDFSAKNALETKHAYILSLGIDCTLEEAEKITIGNLCRPISKELILAKLGRIPITVEMVRREYAYAYPVLHKYGLIRDRSISTPHQMVLDMLDSFSIGYQPNTRKVIKPQELDVFIPSHNLAIEVNGVYWHHAGKKPRDYHAKKTTTCNAKGIQLLQFWDYEIHNRPELIKSIIQAKIGLCQKLHARKLTVKTVPTYEAKRFLKECHLNGFAPASHHLGLYNGSNLVMIMSYGKSRFERGVTEIIRIACAHGITVVGGVSKLLKHASIKGQIVSYADRRISNGNVYKQLGFRHVHNTKFGYWYFDGKNCYSRQQFQKKKMIKEFGFDNSMTEFEMAEQLGLIILCDAGHMKFTRGELS